MTKNIINKSIIDTKTHGYSVIDNAHFFGVT